jgi:hypothetical protein
MYGAFNARDIEGVLAMLDHEVEWANGMEGGHLRGREAVRGYWLRQWSIADPRVDPERFRVEPDGSVAVQVHQVVRDLTSVVRGELSTCSCCAMGALPGWTSAADSGVPA